MKLNLYQVFYRDDHLLDVGCIPIDARGIDPVPLYENKHILYQSTKLKGADYYGVTSVRMREKAGLTKKEIDNFIVENPGYNAYLYGYQGDRSLIQQMNDAHASAIGAAWKRLFQLPLFKSNGLGNINWINCFCNYWVADEKTWGRYIKYLKNTIKALDEDDVLNWMMKNIKFPHREQSYPLHPFILEYLFGLFLLDNPDIKYMSIPNKLMQNIPDNKTFNFKSLREIYENHKTPAGMGDKGTLHNYIETYDKLFGPFRQKPISLLEIGVEQGHSLRMWRDYFPEARITGIDIKRPKQDITGCWFHICDQSNPESLEETFKDTEFDIIIDDGSHVLEHQIISRECLFKKLKKGGLYIIEDDFRDSGRYDDMLLVWRK